MKLRTIVVVAALLVGGCLAHPGAPSGPARAARPDILCFCEVHDVSPQSVLVLDNNLDLVKACRTPRTVADLRASGLPVTDSQLELLRELGLLEDKGAGWQASFPVLREPETRELVAAVNAVVPALARAVAPELERFRAEVARVRARSLYVLLFSYVLDDLVFERFREAKALARFEPRAEQPHWTGTVWIREPRRASILGTNTYEAPGLRLNVVWSRGAGKAMGALMSDADRVEELAHELARVAPVSASLRQVFGDLGVVDGGGLLLVPTVRENAQDPLFAAATALSAKVATEVLARLPPADLQKRLGLARADEALVIAYHEVMWELLAHLERSGVIERPRLVAAPDAAEYVYVIRTTRR